MTTPLVVGTSTPYITPDQLIREPLGIAWGSLVSRNSSSSQDLEIIIQNICEQATAMADGYCNQILHATLDTEVLRGPEFRVTVDNSTGEAQCIMSRSPILQVTSVQVASSALYPRQWSTVPSGFYEVYWPVVGLYGASSPSDGSDGSCFITIAPGFVSWANGRNGFRIKVSYVNGWPHASLTAPAAAGATAITVDDCTGWAPAGDSTYGAAGVIYDGGLQEKVSVTAASAPSGPGTLTLQSALAYKHNPGVMVSTMPAQIRWACALFCAAQALTRGATTTTIHTTGGGAAQGTNAPTELSAEAELLLSPFRRVL